MPGGHTRNCFPLNPILGQSLNPSGRSSPKACPSTNSAQASARFCFASREVRGDPAVLRRLGNVVAFQRSAWTKEQLGAAYVMTYFAQQVSHNPLIDRVTFKRWIDAQPIGHVPAGHARYAAEGPLPPLSDRASTVGRWGDRLYLLDGYRRAVRFWKTQRSDATFEVYVPLT